MTLVKKALFGFGAVLVAAPLTFATVVGQQKGNPCDAVWDVGDATVSGNTFVCKDNDPACDTNPAVGICAIQMNVCAGSTEIAGCTPGALTKLRVKGKNRISGLVPPAPTPTGTCGTAGTLTLKLRAKNKKPSKPFRPQIITKGGAGGGKNKIIVSCAPGDGGTTTTTIPANCADREAPGLPKTMKLTVPNTGSDLDNGFSGNSHNFTVTSGSTLNYCLSNCDATTDSLCDSAGATGAGTANGIYFGAPLPLLANNVPVCVVNRFRDPTLTGTVDLATGEIQGSVNLFSDVYVRAGGEFIDLVCPRCDNGTCKGGQNNGKACTANGSSNVQGSNPSAYSLSTDCPPEAGQRSATLNIDLPLRTGDAIPITGSKPCPGQRFDDECGTGTCGNFCSEVIAPKGGINQTCCSNQPSKPCFPTGEPGGSITRTGTAVIATPAWPDPTYPKTAQGTQLVATFCIASTQDPTVDGVTGLPAPGAIILPASTTIEAQQ